MQRLEILDGMRGYFLTFMLLNHLSFAGGYLLVKFNHGELGYVQDAQGFVFLSGLLIGLVYSGHMAKRGYEAAASKVYKRAFELYRWAIGCILAVIVLGFFLRESSVYWEPWLWSIAERPAMFLALSATLLYQPTYMDILPQYIVYLAVSPPLLWLCVTGRWRTVAFISAFLWLAVQFGVHLPLADAIDAGLRALGSGLTLRAHFNVLAWQAIFMSAMVLGALTATNRLDWQKIMVPERTALAWASVAMVLFFMAWRLGFVFGFIPDSSAERFAALDIRGEFSLLYLANFSALAYLVAWTLIAGPRARNPTVQAIAAALRWVFMLPFLRLLGRHSLQVYVWHVIAIYLLKAFDYHYGPFSELTKTGIALAAVASLAIPALWREWRAAESSRTARNSAS